MRELNLSRRALLLGAALGISGGTSRAQSAGNRITRSTYVFASPGGVPLKLDLYKPVGSTKLLPVIVFVHGGAWMFGDRTTTPDLSRYFAEDGFAMASIDYRLTPSIRYPENLEDVRDAIQWLRRHARSHGLDDGRIGLWGTSAGGHLASLAALVPRRFFEGTEDRGEFRDVRCVLDAYGPTALDLADKQLEQEKPDVDPLAPGIDKTDNPAQRAAAQIPSRSEDPKSPAAFLLGGPPSAVPDKVKAANPITYVSSKAPPFLIMHGLSDATVPHGQSVLLYQALARAGADVSLRLVHGLPHGFFNMPGIDDIGAPFRMIVKRSLAARSESESEQSRAVFDVARDFFRQHLMHG